MAEPNWSFPQAAPGPFSTSNPHLQMDTPRDAHTWLPSKDEKLIQIRYIHTRTMATDEWELS
jgi:hypothetical protein